MSAIADPGRVATHVHLSPLLRQLVEQHAAKNDRSLSAEVRLMLSRAYDELDLLKEEQ